MTKPLRVRCMMVGSRDMHLDMIRAVETVGIRPVIDQTFPLEQLSDAFRYQESGKHFGKIVIGI
jgi:NADPH:quinone reductase-like Zn-dependent oxidoreductase